MTQQNSNPKTVERPNSLETETNTESDMATADNVTTGEDPTKAVLSESGLHKKHLCDYVINVATGCRHGCKFCYVPSTPAVRTRPEMLKEHADVDNAQQEWGKYVLYRDGLGERLEGILERKRTWKETENGCGVVGISFGTDCYMDGRAGKITRNVVDALANDGRDARVLTRNPILALQDADVFEAAGEHVTIGSSIPCMDADQVRAIEPSAPAPEHRLRGLEEFNDRGVQTFVSMSPTYPTQDRSDLRAQLETVAECDPAVVFHEPINPRGGNFAMTVEAAREAGELQLANALESLKDRETWLDYSLNQFAAVQQAGEELGLPVHLWPDDQHLKHTEGAVQDWMQAWRDRQSPEPFGGRNLPEGPMPEIPKTLR
jgi:DNA repair photolyase